VWQVRGVLGLEDLGLDVPAAASSFRALLHLLLQVSIYVSMCVCGSSLRSLVKQVEEMVEVVTEVVRSKRPTALTSLARSLFALFRLRVCVALRVG
jgi:hypothetical protein